MREWFEAQLAAGLPALTGTTISGTVSLKQELLNELLAKWLEATAGRKGAPGPPLDFSRSVSVIKSAAVRAEQGVVLVDFRIAV